MTFYTFSVMVSPAIYLKLHGIATCNLFNVFPLIVSGLMSHACRVYLW